MVEAVESVLEEIVAVFDPDGSQRQEMVALVAAAPLLGAQGAEIRRIATKMSRTQRIAARAHVCLVPRGWGVTNISVPTLERACDLHDAGDVAGADQVLAQWWDDDRMNRVAKRVGYIGTGDPDLSEIGRHRRRLLTKAAIHHLAGAYEASVPILLAQVEGIVIDATDGRKFFSKAPRRADVVDPSKLASIVSGLEAVRTVFAANVDVTQASGGLSRHGVLHGRELGYDTEVQSAKCWSLLDVVVEWALPVAQDLAESRRRQALEAHAGSDALDEHGARVDRREFSETRDALSLLCTSQIPRLRRDGRFREDLVPGVYSSPDFVKRGLPEDHGVKAATSADGQVFWAWRTTASGWVLGAGIEHVGADKFVEWRYGAAQEPSAPQEEVANWSRENHPDWR